MFLVTKKRLLLDSTTRPELRKTRKVEEIERHKLTRNRLIGDSTKSKLKAKIRDLKCNYKINRMRWLYCNFVFVNRCRINMNHSKILFEKMKQVEKKQAEEHRIR